jgi:hypothetical protein
MIKLLYSKEEAREYDLKRPLMYWIKQRDNFNKKECRNR